MQVSSPAKYRRRDRASATGSILALFLMLLSGCGGDDELDVDQEPVITITANQLIDAHNAQAAKLHQVNAYGVIELRWTDDKGDHFAQGDAELWIQQPSRSALRIDKEGEVLIWLGSNDQDWWLFDLASEPRTLYTDALAAAVDSGSSAIGPVHPLTLLDLLGISSVQPIDEASVGFDAESEELMLIVAGRRSPIVLRFDRATMRLSGVEALDESGRLIAASRLREPASVRVAGTNPLNWPKMATTIDIALVEGEGSVRLALNSDMSTAVDDDLAERIFDLETLKHALEPQQISQPSDRAPAKVP